jgi:hypothetical protein
LVAVGLVAALQVLSLVLMGHFVARTPTPGGFGQPLGQYLAIADRLVDAADKEGAAEVLVVGKGDSPAVDDTASVFDILLRAHVAHRFVDGRKAAVFPSHRALALVAPDAGVVATEYSSWPTEELAGGYRLFHLDGSWPRGQLEPIPGPRTFGNGVEVQGYRWWYDRDATEDRGLWLLWQVLWQSSEETHFFVHLLDEDGQKIGQQDGVGYPTAYRRSGDHILSKFDISDTEGAFPGGQRLRVGMYLYPQVENLPVIDGEGNPVADAVVIELEAAGVPR